jgi:hypothetical protein
MSTAYTYLWEFIVEPSQLQEFQRQYGADGPWVALSSARRTGTSTRFCYRIASIRIDSSTVDRWKSIEAHRAFRSAFSREYAELDARCEHLTVRETPLGEFG